jgi:SAM-dependent methyltransferase
LPPESAPLSLLRCPRDGGALERRDEALHCGACRSRYPIHRGIPDFAATAPSRNARWRHAQAYEFAYWSGRGTEALTTDRAHFVEAAKGLAEIFDAQSGAGWRDRVAQIGPAGLGEIHHLPARERWAVEPLAVALDREGLLERAGVHWIAAMGEHLPFANGALSAVVIPNVIDHVADPARLLAEVHRCLRPGAPLWLTGHVTRPAFAPFMSLLAKTRIGYFAGHPHAFTPTAIRRLLVAAGFTIVREQSGPAVDAVRNGGLRSRIKAALLEVRYLLAVA